MNTEEIKNIIKHYKRSEFISALEDAKNMSGDVCEYLFECKVSWVKCSECPLFHDVSVLTNIEPNLTIDNYADTLLLYEVLT